MSQTRRRRCADHRGRRREADERTASAALLEAQRQKALTDAAKRLDDEIKAAEAALAVVDVEAAVKEADPQSASMAKAIGADQNLIAALSHAVFAVAIELGSGVGFWLVFGHGASRRRPDEPQVAAPSTALVPIDRRGAQELQIIDETPQEIIERFFLEIVRPRLNARVQSIAMWAAHTHWCAARGLEAVSHALFARLARWRKERIGGVVYYLDCELVEGYAGLAPTQGPKALPRLDTMSRGTSTTH